jgi:hypothetical protein
MPSTGTYTFDPAIAEILDEAFERAKFDLAAVGHTHIRSALRSLKFMLNSEWATLGIRQFMVQQLTQATTVGMQSFTLPTGCIDLLGAVLRRNGNDTEMYRIARDEYLTIVDKDSSGRPDRFFVDRQPGLTAKTVYIWQAGSNTTDTIIFNVFRQLQDPGNMQNTLQLPAHALEAMVAGLASKLAMKYDKANAQALHVYYRGPDPNRIGGVLDLMRQEDRDRGDISLGYEYVKR